MRTIIIWGASRIGRGLVANIFDRADYRIVFVDSNPKLVAELNAQGRYLIVQAKPEGIIEKLMENRFVALHTSQAEQLRSLFQEDGLLLDIAVHASVLNNVADNLAPLIACRAGKPMDIMMNVNIERPDAFMCQLLHQRGIDTDSIGFTGVFAMCIAPQPPEWVQKKDPLAVWNNGQIEMAISKRHLKCPPPQVPFLRLAEDIEREETRKLYTLNMAHALLCYEGLPLGLTSPQEAADVLFSELSAALDEASVGLTRRFHFIEKEMYEWNQRVISFIMNPNLVDELRRLGVDSRRKLAPGDRLAGPAQLCLNAGINPIHIFRAMLAAADFENDDPGTRAVMAYRSIHSPEQTVEHFSGLKPGA